MTISNRERMLSEIDLVIPGAREYLWRLNK